MSTGGFFGVDVDAFNAACSIGLNAAIALLVLARFSGRDHSTTSASIHAVEKYTGIGRIRAKSALDALINSKLVAKTNSSTTRPRYALETTGVDNLIWLPNEVIDGAANEAPPIERLRQTSDVEALRMFGMLYHRSNLRDEGGLPTEYYRGVYNSHKLKDVGPLSIWRFVLIRDEFVWPDTKPEVARHRLVLLHTLRLVEIGAYLCQSDDSDAIRLFELTPNTMAAARDAADELLRKEEVIESGMVVPLPKHISHVAVLGVIRLVYRAKTTNTSKWYAERIAREKRLVEWYGSLPSDFGRTMPSLLVA